MITGGSLQTEPDVPVIQSAHAILLMDGQYILQLRDNKPNIAAPGQWSLFGGMKKPDETPLQAIKREVYEELSIKPPKFRYLWFSDYFSSFESEVIRTWFFFSDVSSVWHEHELREGQVAKAFDFEQIHSLEMPPVMRQTIGLFQRRGKRRELGKKASFRSRDLIIAKNRQFPFKYP